MVGETLRAWRARMGLSQARAAAALGLHRRTYQEYESGRQGGGASELGAVPLVVRLAAAALESGVPPIPADDVAAPPGPAAESENEKAPPKRGQN